ncbi:MAG: serine/threonine protein kinase [Polyangiaceae bacterium]|nr:serine/threonine protein kinase [Polyangiaceae bacterium]
MDRDKTAGPDLPHVDAALSPSNPRHHAAAPCDEPPVTASAPPAIGDILGGKYRIDGLIANGGMSIVYRATHLELEQPVAIKVLSAGPIVAQEYAVRLKREARAAARIRSEHAVRVFDLGERERTPYLVMEHLAGSDLAAVLARQGPLPVDLAVMCILQSCEALAEAHSMNVVHRDLKPANLFLTSTIDGRPCIKVLDFGISRMTKHAVLSPLTDPGTVLGTPSYMAPEQMESSDRVDARTDIWALGAILYELLVGRPPYAGDALPQIFVQIMQSRMPRPSAARSGVSSALDTIVAKCMNVHPGRRYPSVAELAWALVALEPTPNARDLAERISYILGRRPRDTPVTLASARVDRRARGPRAGRRTSLVLVAASVAAIIFVGVGTYAKVSPLAAPGLGPNMEAASAHVVPPPLPTADDESAISLAVPARRPPVDPTNAAPVRVQELEPRVPTAVPNETPPIPPVPDGGKSSPDALLLTPPSSPGFLTQNH